VRSLVVTTWFPDAASPSRAPFCLEHVRAVQTAGHDVHVVHVHLGRAGGTTRQEVYEGVDVTRVWLDIRAPWTALTVCTLIARHLRRAEILHTMAFSALLVAAPSWPFARKRWVHTEHWNGVVNPASVGPTWQRLAFLRHALRFPHVVSGVTSQLTREMARFARAGSTRVVPCVVEPVEQPAPFPRRPPLRLIGVGLLIDRKNPLLAVETIAWLVGEGLDVNYIWVGEGPLLQAAVERAGELGISDRVSFIGAVAPQQIFPLLQAAHFFFVPSQQENFFTAVAEAIVAGRPVVVPLSGGFDDYCTPQNSVLTHGWSVPALGQAILEAADRFGSVDPESIAATVGDRFSRQRIGAEFSEIYRGSTS